MVIDFTRPFIIEIHGSVSMDSAPRKCIFIKDEI